MASFESTVHGKFVPHSSHKDLLLSKACCCPLLVAGEEEAAQLASCFAANGGVQVWKKHIARPCLHTCQAKLVAVGSMATHS